MDLITHFRRMAENNLWSNDRLHRAVCALQPGEFEAPRTSFFPSIRQTLNHVLSVDIYYLDMLKEGGVGLRAFDRWRDFDDPERRARFFDFEPPASRQLQSLDVFVLPSAWEAFPISVLEAMACGVPQLATAVGGTPEAVRDGETGLLCPPGDPNALARGLVALLSDPKRRERMAKASRVRHAEAFTVDRMVASTAAVYDAALPSQG